MQLLIEQCGCSPIDSEYFITAFGGEEVDTVRTADGDGERWDVLEHLVDVWRRSRLRRLPRLNYECGTCISRRRQKPRRPDARR